MGRREAEPMASSGAQRVAFWAPPAAHRGRPSRQRCIVPATPLRCAGEARREWPRGHCRRHDV